MKHDSLFQAKILFPEAISFQTGSEIDGQRQESMLSSSQRLLTSSGQLKEPSCKMESINKERCSLHQKIPVHLAGTRPIREGTHSSSRPECAPVDVDCEPECPSCNPCTKVI